MHLTTPFIAALLAVPMASAQLNQLAKRAGKLYFGTATDNPELTNKKYVKKLSDISEFGQITPGNAMKVSLTLVLSFYKFRLLIFS